MIKYETLDENWNQVVIEITEETKKILTDHELHISCARTWKWASESKTTWDFSPFDENEVLFTTRENIDAVDLNVIVSHGERQYERGVEIGKRTRSREIKNLLDE